MEIQHYFDAPTGTLAYLVHDGRAGAVIDPVRGYDAASGRTSWAPSEAIASEIDRVGLEIPFVIDTHAHADHMTGLPFFKERYGARTVTGAGIGEIQRVFRDLYHLGDDVAVDGRQFDRLVEDGETLAVGTLELTPLHTPGHTPAHVAWQVEDVVFVGDTLFMPDYGAARCDFPGGSAGVLYDSIQRLYALPDATRLLTGHDYQPGGRPLAFASTVAEQKRGNVQIDAATSREDFIAFREERDAGLAAPKLILPSLQVNIRAGDLPEPESNGTAYLKIPLDRLGSGS